MQPSQKVFEDHERKLKFEVGADSEGSPAINIITCASDGSEITASIPTGTTEGAQQALDKINIEDVQPLLKALRGRGTVSEICEVLMRRAK